MKDMCRLFSSKQLVSTPYHPICSGFIDKFNDTSKNMLRHMCAEKPKDWIGMLDHCCSHTEKLNKIA